MENNRKAFMIVAVLFLMSIVGVFNIGCASQHKARDIDTKIELSAPVNQDSVVGVKDGYMIYQKKVLMSEQLRSLENEVYNLEARVYGGPRYLDNYGLYGALKNCRTKVGAVDGKLPWTETRDYVTPDYDEQEVGIEDKKRIIGLSEEFLKDRIARFRTYKKVLIGREDEYETKLTQCELELKAQKVASH